MHSTFLFWTVALLVTSLFGSVLGFRSPVDEVFRRKRFDVKNKLTKRDLICADNDDYLIAFQMDEDVSVPFCSSFIDIPQETTTSYTYTRTTIIDLTTTTTTADVTATVASNTKTITITEAPFAPMRKRQAAPAASDVIASCQGPSGLNLTVINSVSTACSCLFIPTSTILELTTETSTKTEGGTDYRFATVVGTVTSGEATVTITVFPTITPITSTPVSSVTTPSSVNGTVPVIGSSGFPRSETLPESSTAPPVESSFSPSSVIPSSSVNMTATLPESSGFPTSVTSPATSFPSGSPSGVPSAHLNTSTTTGTSASAAPTAPSNSTMPPYISPSGAPTVPSNGSSPTTSGALPSSTSGSDHCPAVNGSTYTTQGQTFLILCDTNYVGPDIEGLYTPDLYSCVEDCAIANVGFSQSRCYAASYIPNNDIGTDCFFRTLNSTRQPEFDPKAISALLINNTLTTPSNATLTGIPKVAPSTSMNSSYSTGATAYSSANSTSLPTFISSIYANATSYPSASPTISTNITTSPSSFPTISTNITFGPSSFPAISTNISSMPTFSGGPTASDNRTIPASSGFSTGWPSVTANSSSWCHWVTSTVAESTVTEFVTDTVTDTVTSYIATETTLTAAVGG